MNVSDTVVPRHLTTLDSESFAEGIKELAVWCTDTLTGYKKSGYEIVFNLAAALKSLQGYLNTVGMLYADRIMYLFESSANLIFIPHLPIQVDNREKIKQYAVQLSLMVDGNATLPLSDVDGLAPTLFDRVGEEVCRSNWGTLIWGQVCDDIYGKELLSFPGLRYLDKFNADFKNAPFPLRIRLQKKLAVVSARLLESHGNTAILKGGQSGDILYDRYEKKKYNNHPLDQLSSR